MGAKAKESAQVEKARAKLKKTMEREHQRMTQEALRQMERVIEHQLERHKNERINLTSKNIELFDSNRHPAKVKSKFVAHLLSELKGEPVKAKAPKQLKGRVTSA